MNQILLSFILIFFITIIVSLLGSFFDINQLYYLPFILWFIALCIMNMFLEKNHENIFMKEITN